MAGTLLTKPSLQPCIPILNTHCPLVVTDREKYWLKKTTPGLSEQLDMWLHEEQLRLYTLVLALTSLEMNLICFFLPLYFV